ncbi:hypothetical protein JL916_10615 [Staphylococcus pseudintermedius]|uniref:Uncharacterized protein n=2 Tax=Staphylococcus pseudintermedius TaxID=283734 RepID=A0A8H9C196_STAPS|nr:hypothetical protein [Staphylococcus pseudintermedius]ASQ51049.1 hypothetical protein SPS5912_08750 [Staphylococcus pseudintermedius]EGQ0294122.1 hypothetical protein [Staphylococcus pseudintermedius]EGQ0310523.1 hypothetical protein [Staphylococcus pseudintermedius]EGQ0319864.1 hypothetical protein [Staphylococcus pseudintermedius]EGQ0373033.1 hypothetical protein [Staphylococcus pseudintermedius]
MTKPENNMPKSQQILLAIIIVIFILEIVLTAFFVSFSSPIFKGLTILHGILLIIFFTRQVKRKGL